MSNLPGNPYMKRTMGPVEAAVALAYEQRTANLIAERDALDRMPAEQCGAGWDDQWESLQGQINARLGIIAAGADQEELRSTIARLTRERDEWEGNEQEQHSEVVKLHATIEKLGEKLKEARHWARHGYEIGQRSCTWADHGVAPEWLTEGHRPEALRSQVEEAGETQNYIAELEGLTTRLSQQLIGYSNRANEAMRPHLAKAWYAGRDAGWRKGSLGHKMHCRSVGPNPYEETERKES